MEHLSIRVGTALVFLGPAISAQTTTLVSRTASSNPAEECSHPSISADGRFVAFESEYGDLVPGDTNGKVDIFLFDRQSGATSLVSRSLGGDPGNGDSLAPSLSADGRFVAFESLAENLVPGDANGLRDVFVRDLQAGTTALASRSSAGVPANNQSFAASISGDGRFVAFGSQASSLVPDDPSGSPDIYVHDLQTGTTEFVSLSTGGVHGNFTSLFPSISFDGRYVAFQSYASNLVAVDTNGRWDIFVRDRQAGTTELVSRSSAGVQGTIDSWEPSISADGRFVAFTSNCPNLSPQDPDLIQDIFLRDRLNGTTSLVSQSSTGAKGNSASLQPAISGDARFVAFTSQATNLVPGDGNGRGLDIFVRDVPGGTTELSNLSSLGVQGNDRAEFPSISAQGRFVAFASLATNLVPNDTTGHLDILLRDAAASIASYCYGDGSDAACPCGNAGAPGHGCENSASTGGAILGGSGAPSLSGDTLVLLSAGELPSALSIVLQGTVSIGPVSYGDGLRCVGGALKRLYVRNAVGGIVTAPQGGDPSISARSAALGNLIPAGGSRFYQVYYRDPSASFCPSPPGNTWNVSSGIEAVWGY